MEKQNRSLNENNLEIKLKHFEEKNVNSISTVSICVPI